MKFLNTNGDSYNLNLAPYRKHRLNASAPAKKLRELLKVLFPCDVILEEVPIKIGRSTLYIDFLIVGRSIAIEVNGEQHRKFVKRFHGTVQGFLEAKKRDKDKAEWCKLNEIELVVLDDDKRDEWEQLVQFG